VFGDNPLARITRMSPRRFAGVEKIVESVFSCHVLPHLNRSDGNDQSMADETSCENIPLPFLTPPASPFFTVGLPSVHGIYSGGFLNKVLDNRADYSNNLLMMNFTRRDLQRGQQAMERTLTTAGRIRRQFAAGRPPKPGNWVDPISALRTLAARLDAITGAMSAERLSPRDLSAFIVTSQLMPGTDLITSTSITGIVERFPLVDKGKSRLSDAVEKVLSNPRRVVVGAIFEILDRETTPEPTRKQWGTPVFRDDDGVAQQIMAIILLRMKAGKRDA
jgi:hypothetical protein